MKCPNCGKEIANGSKFCEHCGKQIIVLNNEDEMLLNIIRVASFYPNLLAAYKARRRCYKLCKKQSHRADYKEHVQQLQLDYYPNEFKKALIGESYYKCLVWCIIGAVALCWCVIPSALFIWLIISQKKKKLNEFNEITK